MDLLQTVRKEGSRGGRSEFKWEDVKQDAQRENYLGHSLMAPVGRWQQGRDLNWYAKGDDESDTRTAAERLADEKRKVKEAEEDAMLRAMGLPVPDRASTNANLEPLGAKAGDDKAEESKAGECEEEKDKKKDKERSRRHRERDGERRRHRSRSRSRHRRDRRRDRSRSRERRDRDDDGRERRRGRDGDVRERQRHRSRSREHRRREDRHEQRRDRSRSRDRERRRRTRSPHERRD